MAYPLPSSYPQIFDRRLLTSTGRLRNAERSDLSSSTVHDTIVRLKSVPIYSAVRTTSALGQSITSRVQFIDKFLRTGADVDVLGPGIGREELFQLKEDLIHMAENYAGGSANDEQGAGGSEYDDGEFDLE